MEICGAITGIMSCLCAPNCLHEPLLRTEKYLKRPESLVEKLESKMDELTARANDNQMKLNIAELQGKKPTDEVSLWLKNVNNVKNEVSSIQNEIGSETKRLNGCFPNYCLRLGLGKRIYMKLKVVDALLEKGRFSDDSLTHLIPEKGRMLTTVTIVGKKTAERSLNEIWGYLMDDETGTIGVWGMGGVGKTTIMKEINNRLLKETTDFHKVMWITVSKVQNLQNLQDNIAQELALDIVEEKNVPRRAAKIFEALRRINKFVLILDDLWKAFSLEDIGIPSPNKDNGCKLVLTTRLREVCQGIETQRVVEVKGLNGDEAWDLFKEKVGNDVLPSSDIETIAKEVAEECAGLPLAIVTVGLALRNVNDVEEWKYALTELRESCMRRKGMGEVFARLEFSYRRLRDDPTRACLLYCALYPEDHPIEIKELIEHWIWEGLMGDVRKTTKAYMLKAKSLVNELKDSCLLESCVNQYRVECVKMHDLIRDMAIGITRTDPRFFIKAGLRLTIPPSGEEWPEDVERVSLMRNDLKCLSGQPMCNKLSTLLLQHNRLLNKLSDSFFLNMQNLKVLNLSYTSIEELPESVSFLQNLSTLLLGYCRNLKKVPSLKNLIGLKVLDLSFTLELKELPQGMDMLSNLRCLNISYTGVNCFPAESVHMFRHVEELLMRGIEWGSDATFQKGRAYIEDLIKLKNLAILEVKFYNSEVLDWYTRSEHWDQLQDFNISIGRTHEDSTKLGRKGIAVFGERLLVRGSPVLFPSNTSDLHLYNCPDIMSQLSMLLLNVSNLKECKIKNCNRIECIVSAGDQNNLSTLEKLELVWLQGLRMLCKGVVPPDTLRCLKILNVRLCPSLKQLFSPGLLQHLRNLEVIKVQFCKGMEEIIATEKGDEDEEEKEGIVEETNSCNDNYHNATIIQLSRLRQLELYALPNLRSIYKGVMVCDSLQTITVKCPNLKRLPLSIGNGQPPPASLKQISGSQEWWRSLRWDHPDDVTFFHQFFNDDFSRANVIDFVDRSRQGGSALKTISAKRQCEEGEKKIKDNKPKQLRSNLNALLRLVSSMHLEERHIKHIRRTPFWDFFNPFINGTVKRKAVRKCDENVSKIVKTYTADWNAFRISDKLVKLRSNDIALIFGIHGGNKKITLGGVSRPNEEIKKRMCGDANRLTPPIIEKLIFEALKGEMEENNEDVARLLCLYAFVTVFFPTSSTQLSWSYMTYVEDLDNMKDYNWPAAIRSNLEASIERSHTKPENVTGCVIALLFWLCEHSSILKPTKKNAIPRFLKWNLGKLTKVLSKISLQTLKSDEVYEQEIKFTKAEATKFNVEKLSLDIGRERAYSDSDSDEEDDENEDEGSESTTDGEDDDEHAQHLVGDVRVDDVEQVEIAHAANPNNDEADQQQKQQQATTAQVDQLTARIVQLEKEKAENHAHIAELKMQTEELSTELLKVTHDRNAQKGEYKALKEKYEAVLKDLHGKAEVTDGNIVEETIEFNVHNITQAMSRTAAKEKQGKMNTKY